MLAFILVSVNQENLNFVTVNLSLLAACRSVHGPRQSVVGQVSVPVGHSSVGSNILQLIAHSHYSSTQWHR